MTKFEARLRRFGCFEFLGALGLVAVLLSARPTQAQQFMTIKVDQQGNVVTSGQPGGDLDQLRASLARIAAELDRARAQLDRIGGQTDERKIKLKVVADHLKATEKTLVLKEKQRAAVATKAKVDEASGIRFVTSTAVAGQGMDKRLSDLDRKLDQVLQELQNLRGSMGMGPAMKKKGPAGGGKGGGFGFGASTGGGVVIPLSDVTDLPAGVILRKKGDD